MVVPIAFPVGATWEAFGEALGRGRLGGGQRRELDQDGNAFFQLFLGVGETLYLGEVRLGVPQRVEQALRQA